MTHRAHKPGHARTTNARTTPNIITAPTTATHLVAAGQRLRVHLVGDDLRADVILFGQTQTHLLKKESRLLFNRHGPDRFDLVRKVRKGTKEGIIMSEMIDRHKRVLNLGK
jgi:hypothetical protein